MVNKNTIENIVIILVAVIMFQTVPKLPFVGQYFNNPLILLIVAGAFIVLKDKIVKLLGFLDKSAADGLVIIFISMLIFNSIPKFDIVKTYIAQYTLVIFIIGILMLIFKDAIANQIGGK